MPSSNSKLTTVDFRGESAGNTSFHRITAAGLNADETHALLATRYRYNSAKVINHHYRPPCLQKNRHFSGTLI